MLILLLILSIASCVVWISVDDDGLLIGTSGMCAIVCIICLLVNAYYLVNMRCIDAQIELYAEENIKIETAIDELVSEYMDFESTTLTNLKSDSSITLVSLYPELKSDELVKAQIETYQKNNSEIKRLKEKKLKKSVYTWWIYFGK